MGQLIRGGAITEAQAKNHSMRHVVTQAVGLETIDVHTCEQELQEGDLLLLTTDGVHGVVEHRGAVFDSGELPDVGGGSQTAYRGGAGPGRSG